MLRAINSVNISGSVKNLKTVHSEYSGVYVTRFILITPASGDDTIVTIPKWFPVEFFTSYDPKLNDSDDVVVTGSLGNRRIPDKNVYEFYVSATDVDVMHKRKAV